MWRTLTGRRMQAVATRIGIGNAFVVRDATGRVIVVLSGADAADAAAHWTDRGYEVVETTLD
jgi:hypothetical protein